MIATLADLEVALRDRGADITAKRTDGSIVVTLITPFLSNALQAVGANLGEAVEKAFALCDRKLAQLQADKERRG